jgi:hypothetical protein
VYTAHVSTSSWWPFKRRSDTSKKTKSPGSGDDRRLSETRRIVREAFERAEQPEKLSVKAPVTQSESSLGYSSSEEDGVIHVCFHQTGRLFETTFVKVDPITRRSKRVVKRFSKSRVYYRDDGALIDDDNWIG